MFKFSEEQKEIISSNKKRIFVSAIAGSGKTQVIVERTKRVRERVLILTFTNEVKIEIKKRLINNKNKNFDIKTIDSLYIDIFRNFWYSSNFKTNKNITNFNIKEDFNKEINKEAFDKNIIENNEFYLTKDCWHKKIILSNLNTIDFNEKVIMHFENLYSEIIIDEAQDLVKYDLSFLDFLSKKLLKTSIILLGDYNQSIYHWRGADLKEFKDLINKNNYHEMNLTKFFRGKKNIHTLGKIFRVNVNIDYENLEKLFLELISYSSDNISIINIESNIDIDDFDKFTLIKNSIKKGDIKLSELFEKIKSHYLLKEFSNHINKLESRNDSLKEAIENEIIKKEVLKGDDERIKEILFEHNWSEWKCNRFLSLIYNHDYIKSDKILKLDFKIINERKNIFHNDENVIITLSSSKGTEYKKVVFFIDIDNILYFYKKEEDEQKRSEAINQIYVGITRAKEKLIIIYKWDKMKKQL